MSDEFPYEGARDELLFQRELKKISDADPIGRIKDLQSRLTAAEARVKELSELAKGALSFSIHLFSCDILKGTDKAELRCTCGLDNLRAELDKLKGNS